MDDGVMLKWKADFGSTLGSYVILGASSARHYLLQPIIVRVHLLVHGGMAIQMSITAAEDAHARASWL